MIRSPAPSVRQKRRRGPSETEKKNDASREAVSRRLGISDPGDDPYRDHGFLADDPGIHHVTADRIQCQHAVE